MSRKLHIAILGTRGIPNRYGGFEQCAEYLALGLVQRGHRVSVYNSSLHPYAETQWHSVEIIPQYDPEKLFGTFAQFVYDFNCTRHARNRHFDVCLHFGYTSSSIWYWLWSKKSVHLVNMDGLEHQRGKYSLLTKAFLRLAEILATKKAAALIADNPGIEHYLASKYANTIRCIGYGSEIPQSFSVEVLERFNIVPQAYDLVIARIEPENHVREIVETYAANKQLPALIVVGNMNTALARELKQHECDHVRFVGGIYDKQVLDNLRHHCRMYLHGHSVGGTNPSLLEAMAASVIVCAHDNDFNRSVLGNEALYFRSKSDLTDVIAQLPQNTEQWKALNLLKIQQQHTWESVVVAYEKLCLEMVER